MKRRLHTVNEKKKIKRYLVSHIERLPSLLLFGEEGFFTVFSFAGTIRMGKISRSFPITFLVNGTTAVPRGQVSVGVGKGLRFLVMNERCSIVAGVLGSLVVMSEREGARGCIYVGPTRSVCHVITWMGGRYMKDRWALVIWCRVYTSFM